MRQCAVQIGRFLECQPVLVRGEPEGVRPERPGLGEPWRPVGRPIQGGHEDRVDGPGRVVGDEHIAQSGGDRRRGARQSVERVCGGEVAIAAHPQCAVGEDHLDEGPRHPPEHLADAATEDRSAQVIGYHTAAKPEPGQTDVVQIGVADRAHPIGPPHDQTRTQGGLRHADTRRGGRHPHGGRRERAGRLVV